MGKTAGSVLLLVLGMLIGAAMVGNAQSPGTSEPMVTGVGGVFFKSAEPERLRDWYRQNLGIESPGQGVNFFWRELEEDSVGFTVWSLFAEDTDYFGPSNQTFMINFRVRNLDALLARLETNGVQQVKPLEEYPYGRFAWVDDGDGNRIELWEPASITTEEFFRQSAAPTE